MPTRLAPTPHTPRSLGHTHLLPFKAGGMATGGPGGASILPQAVAQQGPILPQGTPIQHSGPRPVKALRPGQAPSWEQCHSHMGAQTMLGEGRTGRRKVGRRPSRVMVRSIFTDGQRHAAGHTITCKPRTPWEGGGAGRAQRLAIALTILCGHIDIQVEAVFIGLLDISSDNIQVGSEPDGQHDFGHGRVDVLGAHWGKVCGVPDARPGWGWLRGQETFFADGGSCIGHPQVLVHRPQDLTGQWHPGTP